MEYQKVTPIKLGQAAVTTSYATLYTAPLLTRTYVKQFDFCNTTGSPINIYLHLVPSAGTVGTSNAMLYQTAVPGYGTLQWTGVQILNAGDTIQVKAASAGVTVTAAGGEAV